MATQPPITAFFTTKKRRATDVLERDAKLLKGDPTLVKFGSIKSVDNFKRSEGNKSHEPEATKPFTKKAAVDQTVKTLANKAAIFKKPTECSTSNSSVTENNSKHQSSDVFMKDSKISDNNDDSKINLLEKNQIKEEVVEDNAETISGSVKQENKGIVVKEEITDSCEISSVMKQQDPTTPRKGGCDAKTFLTTKSPYRPDCRSETPVKYFRMEGKAKHNETTPAKTPKTPGSIMKAQDRPPSAVKKSIRFEDETATSGDGDAPVDTDDIIQAANDLVEKLKNKSRNLSDLSKPKPGKKPEVMTAGLLKKKLARTAKFAELKSSLSRLGQQATELIKMEKRKKQLDEPKITKFDAIEIEVPRSPHKGALASPMKSPAKPAHERFAHLIHRTGSAAVTLPLPLGYQRLLDLFSATDTVCSMMLNRGELITFKKLKPAVQELTRANLTERHLGQMAAVLPDSFIFSQEKLRNFGSTSKVDHYQLVIAPNVKFGSGSIIKPTETTNLVKASDSLRMTPKTLLLRKEAFHRNLLDRTMDKHAEFLLSLDPPLNIVRSQLTRWHPNFPVDLVPDVAPVSLPEPPTMVNAPTSAKDVLERAKKLLSANTRMKNALEAASLSSEAAESESPPPPPQLTAETKAALDKKVAAHDPLKGISKSLLDRIRAKQAAKALEAMQVTPADEKELMLLTKLPDAARVVRGMFVDNQKGVLPWLTVLEKFMFSAKHASSQAEVETVLRRLVTEVPDWLTVFKIRLVEYLKLDRAAPFGPIVAQLEAKVANKRRAIS